MITQVDLGCDCPYVATISIEFVCLFVFGSAFGGRNDQEAGQWMRLESERLFSTGQEKEVPENSGPHFSPRTESQRDPDSAARDFPGKRVG